VLPLYDRVGGSAGGPQRKADMRSTLWLTTYLRLSSSAWSLHSAKLAKATGTWRSSQVLTPGLAVQRMMNRKNMPHLISRRNFVVRFEVLVRVFEQIFQSGDLLLGVTNAIQRIVRAGVVQSADTGAQTCSNSRE
jgi:hypothetical protein